MKRTALAFLLLLVPLALMARTRAVRTGPIDSPAAWLRHRALSHASFARMVASADVVALGDVTHATHETYAAKQAIVPRLVARGFRVLAFEAPYGEYKALDEYVLVGTGDPAAALNVPLYWFWDTNEILDLVRWARAQNAAGLTPPIRIAGIDPTSPRVTAAEVIAYLERVDPPFAAEVASIYHCIREGYTGTNRCRTKVASVRVSISLKRDAYLLASSLHEYEEVLHAARVIEQGERVLADGMPARDEPMAENVLRFERSSTRFCTCRRRHPPNCGTGRRSEGVPRYNTVHASRFRSRDRRPRRTDGHRASRGRLGHRAASRRR
ncbi:MAG: erythromycin esterase family protein [Thermoanaerobaculia bacterium]